MPPRRFERRTSLTFPGDNTWAGLRSRLIKYSGYLSERGSNPQLSLRNHEEESEGIVFTAMELRQFVNHHERIEKELLEIKRLFRRLTGNES